MFLLLTTPKSSAKHMETDARSQNSGQAIFFDTEFRIPFKLKGSQKKKRRLIVDLVADDGQHGEKLGTWEFELSRRIDDEREQEMAATLNDSSTAVLLYRLVVKKRKEVADVQRYFDHPKAPPVAPPAEQVAPPPPPPKAEEAVPEIQAEEDRGESAQPEVAEPVAPAETAEQPAVEPETEDAVCAVEPETEDAILAEQDDSEGESTNISLGDDSLTMSLNSLRDSTIQHTLHMSVEKQNRMHIRRAFIETLVEQSRELSLIAFNQACIEFSKTVYATFHRDLGEDISPFFVKILDNFGVLALPGLTDAQFEEFMSPFNSLVRGFLEKSWPIVELFPLLATIINFGIAIARNGLLYTTAHISSLHALEASVDVLILRLVHSLVAALGPSIESTNVDVEGRRSTDVLRNEAGVFMRLTRQYQVPSCIVQSVVADCCRTVDVLIFNSLVSAEDAITVSTVKQLGDRMGQIQELFECSESGCLFPNLTRFEDTASLFLGTFRMDKLGQPNPFTRSIADRCSPAPDVYPLSFDRLGPRIADREELKVPPHEIVSHFTYEWLFSQEHIKLF